MPNAATRHLGSSGSRIQGLDAGQTLGGGEADSNLGMCEEKDVPAGGLFLARGGGGCSVFRRREAPCATGALPSVCHMDHGPPGSWVPWVPLAPEPLCSLSSITPCAPGPLPPQAPLVPLAPVLPGPPHPFSPWATAFTNPPGPFAPCTPWSPAPLQLLPGSAGFLAPNMRQTTDGET